MNKYILLFGYIFYRINTAYRKITKLAEDYQPISIIAIMQTMVLFDIFLVIYTVFIVDIKEYKLPTIIKYLMALAFTTFYTINVRILVKRYWEFVKIWKDEPKAQKRKRGWLITIVFVVIFLMAPIYLVLRKKFEI